MALLEKLTLFLKAENLQVFCTGKRTEVPSNVGVCKPAAQRLEAPKGNYPSRVHAIDAAEPAHSPLPGLEVLQLQEAPRTRLEVYSGPQAHYFYGNDALSRLCFIPPDRLGRRAQTVLTLVNVTAVRFLITDSQLGRHVGGSSPSASRRKELLSAEVLEPGVYRVFDNIARERHSRFYTGLGRLHLSVKILYLGFRKKYPEETKVIGNLLSYLISRIICTANFQNEECQDFLDSLEVIHKDDLPETPLTKWIESLPVDLRISLYRLRRSWQKTEAYGLPLLRSCLDRRCQDLKEAVAVGRIDLPKMQEVLDFMRPRLIQFLQSRPELKEIPKKFSIHKASASLLCSRSEGGASREMQLWVALKRALRGIPTRTQNVFGDLPEDITKEHVNLFAQKSNEIRQEYREAAELFFHLFETGQLPTTGLVTAIYPEREPKARTFVLEFAPPELFLRVAAYILRQFLKTFSESAWVMGAEDNIQQIFQRATGHLRFTDDASQATDWFPLGLPSEIYQPIVEFLEDDLVRAAVDYMSASREVSVSERRPQFLKHFSGQGFQKFSFWIPETEPKPFTDLGSKPYFVINWRQIPDQVRKVIPLYQFRRLIEEWMTQGSFILKSPTGTGKSVLLASFGKVIISLPSIEQVMLLSASLEYFKIPHHTRFVGKKDPPRDSNSTILCTPYHAPRLWNHHKDFLYVNDEADTRIEDVQMNTALLLKRGAQVVVCTATPESLQTGLPLREVSVARPFAVEELAPIDIGQMLEDIETDLATEQFLIITFSEPHSIELAQKLEMRHVDVVAICQKTTEEELTAAFQSRVVISTNKMRSGVTLPRLEKVFDLQRRYDFVIDPATGLSVGVLNEVAPSDILQLKGRIGRTKDGVYQPVKSGRKAGPAVKHFQASTRLVSFSGEVGVRDLPLYPDKSSYETAVQTTLFASVLDAPRDYVLGLSNHKDPLLESLRNLESGGGEFERIQLYALFHKFNFPQKVMQYQRTVLPIAERLSDYSSLLANRQPLRACFIALQIFSEAGVCGREIGLVEGFVGRLSEISVQFDRSDLATNTERRMFAAWHWDQLAIAGSEYVVGKIRDYTVSRKPTENIPSGQLCLPVGLRYGFKTMTLEYDYLLSVDADFTLLRPQMKALLPLIQTSPLHDLESFHLAPSGQDMRARLQMKPGGPPNAMLQPEDAQTFFEALTTSITDCLPDSQKIAVTRQVTSGVNMASEGSFPVLNYVGVGTLQLARQNCGLDGCVYGDDVAGYSVNDNVDEISLLREYRQAFGLLVKKQASGIQRTPEKLSVFAERFFSGDGSEHIGVKPLSVMRAFAALNPGELLSSETYYPEDYLQLVQSVQMQFPAFALGLGLRASKTHSRRRVTVTSHLASQFIHSFPRVTNDPDETVSRRRESVRRVEALLIAIAPSTRGRPQRVEHLPRRSTLSSAQCGAANQFLDSIDEQFLHQADNP